MKNVKVQNSVLFIGDSHGDLGFLLWAADRADRYGADHMVQVGDFGFWEHTYAGKRFLDELNERLESRGRKIHWVDGNHECFDLLYEYPSREDGMVEIRPNIIYIPRGTRWNWGGVDFLGIGGAYSIDEYSRTWGESWWPQELITQDEVYKCTQGGPTDVVVSHDVPGLVDLGRHLWKIGVTPWSWDASSLKNRNYLTEVFKAVDPKFWFHGHYHMNYQDRLDGCNFIGLDANVNQYGQNNWTWEWALYLFDPSEVVDRRR